MPDTNTLRCRWCNWTTALFTHGKMTGFNRLDTHIWEAHPGEANATLAPKYQENDIDKQLARIGIDPYEAYSDRCACGSAFGPEGECPNCEALFVDDEPMHKL